MKNTSTDYEVPIGRVGVIILEAVAGMNSFIRMSF